jgi:hypothetical protein
VLVLPQIVVLNSSITANFYGLATGDFNLSFVPGGAKSTYQSVTLNHEQIVPVDRGQIFELPVTAGTAMEVGAVSLILNFPADKLEVLGVYLGGNLDMPVEFGVEGDELRIGSYTSNPVILSVDDRLLTLRIKVIGTINQDETLKFILNTGETNEIANGTAKVIDGAVLKMAEISSTEPGIDLNLANYPNPFRETTTFTYSIPADGKVTIEICSILGSKVKTLLDEAKTAGNYSFEAQTADLNPGIYTATIRVSMSKGVQSRTIKIICKQ